MFWANRDSHGRAGGRRGALTPPDRAAAQRPRADMESAPTNGGKARGYPGKADPAMPQNPCRADSISARFVAARGSAGGISGLRAAAARRLASETRLRGAVNPALYEQILCFGPDNRDIPDGRRAGCPHPAGTVRRHKRPGRIWNPPLRTETRPVTSRENANPAMPQTPVGDDSISARFAPPRTPAGGINPAPTNGGQGP